MVYTVKIQKKNKDAKKYKKISYNKYLSDNLKVMDSAAISVARENKIPIRVFSILEKDCFNGVYNNNLNYSEINDV